MLKDKNQRFLPKRNRIQGFTYLGINSYFITICTSRKREVFIKAKNVDLVIKYLKEAAAQYGFAIYAYCFMPDHFHLLINGENEKASLQRFIKMFKQKSSYYFKQKYGLPLWQPSYYDHVLRRPGDLRQIAEYIFNNPVKKGMVDDYRKYPYLGSMAFNIYQGHG